MTREDKAYIRIMEAIKTYDELLKRINDLETQDERSKHWNVNKQG